MVIEIAIHVLKREKRKHPKTDVNREYIWQHFTVLMSVKYSNQRTEANQEGRLSMKPYNLKHALFILISEKKSGTCVGRMADSRSERR